ncbi:cupredoxin domain-containing protein [Blastococcus sp. URHD0036]|uniref:cupredoxin domain-containing protein n=1 Tax=Blastococcus sp. URHD0036 TaxID=1380356 RepID=UPI000495AAB1|nr:cupredoxin domain-containing protein [Blastococcus sp. URHD0036]
MSTLLIAATAACGSSADTDGSAPTSSASSSSGPSSTAASAGATPSTTTTSATAITIDAFAYTTPASVPPGAMVSVTNADAEAHTVTADDGGAFDVTILPGATAVFTAPTTPGSYAFSCLLHGNMHGVLVVQ